MDRAALWWPLSARRIRRCLRGSKFGCFALGFWNWGFGTERLQNLGVLVVGRFWAVDGMIDKEFMAY